MLLKVVLVVSLVGIGLFGLTAAQDDGLFTSAPAIIENNNDLTSQQSVSTTQQSVSVQTNSPAPQSVSSSYSDNVLFTSPPLAVESNEIPDPVALLTNTSTSTNLSSVPPISVETTTISALTFPSSSEAPIIFEAQSSTSSEPFTSPSSASPPITYPSTTTTEAPYSFPSSSPASISTSDSEINLPHNTVPLITFPTPKPSTISVPPRFEIPNTTPFAPIYFELPTSTSTPHKPNYFNTKPSTPHFTPTKPPPYKQPSKEEQSLIQLAVTKILPSQRTCGFQNEKLPNMDPSLANIDEFPWLALLRYSYTFGFDAGFRCAGSLISKQYVLTAANCALTKHKLLNLQSVRLGEWKISSHYDCLLKNNREECAQKYIDVGVSKALVHPQYNCDYGNDNLAILRLNTFVYFTDFVKPLCLPNSNLLAPNDGTLLVTAGWGATEYGHFTDVKTKIDLPVLTDLECSKRLKLKMHVFKNQVCVGTNFFKEQCGPDYGAPIMNADRNGRPQWYLEGVVAAGFGFGKNGIPELYTRIPPYVNWILTTLAQDALHAV